MTATATDRATVGLQLRMAAERVRLTRQQLERHLVDRDALVREALEAGVPRRLVAEGAGLTRQQVGNIARGGRR